MSDARVFKYVHSCFMLCEMICLKVLSYIDEVNGCLNIFGVYMLNQHQVQSKYLNEGKRKRFKFKVAKQTNNNI